MSIQKSRLQIAKHSKHLFSNSTPTIFPWLKAMKDWRFEISWPFWLLQSPWFFLRNLQPPAKNGGGTISGEVRDGAFQFRKSENWKVSFSSLVLLIQKKMGDCNLVLDVTIILKITFFFPQGLLFAAKLVPQPSEALKVTPPPRWKEDPPRKLSHKLCLWTRLACT